MIRFCVLILAVFILISGSSFGDEVHDLITAEARTPKAKSSMTDCSVGADIVRVPAKSEEIPQKGTATFHSSENSVGRDNVVVRKD